jgi:hypothetical protein
MSFCCLCIYAERYCPIASPKGRSSEHKLLQSGTGRLLAWWLAPVQPTTTALLHTTNAHDSRCEQVIALHGLEIGLMMCSSRLQVHEDEHGVEGVSGARGRHSGSRNLCIRAMRSTRAPSRSRASCRRHGWTLLPWQGWRSVFAMSSDRVFHIGCYST